MTHPNRIVQRIVDAHEQEMEAPSSMPAYRTVFSDYKHRCTGKFYGACTPAGAVAESEAPPIMVPGSCPDDALTRLVGALDNALKFMTTLADKGFMMQNECALPASSASAQPLRPTRRLSAKCLRKTCLQVC